MARLVEKQMVEIYDGWSVMMTRSEQQLWGALSRVPYGTVVAFSDLLAELGITANHLYVLKSHLASLLKWGISIKKQPEGYVVSRLH